MRKTIVYIIAIVFAVSGCQDYLDINDNPNAPTGVTNDLLLPFAQVAMSNSLSMNAGGISAPLSMYVHQTVQRRYNSDYEYPGNAFAITTAWDAMYEGSLKDLDVIIKQAEADDNLVYSGIAKIMKAYLFSYMVDVWGSIPFSEFNKMPDILHPAFDDGSDIYPQLIVLLNQGIEDLRNNDALNRFVPSDDDLIYGGNVENWIRAAYSIKLKLYNQIRLVEDVTDEVNAIINSDSLINNATQDFELWYGASNNPENRNPMYITEYPAEDYTEYYISHWFYELMMGERDDLFTGIQDPRVPYYWYRQVSSTDGVDAPYTNDNGFVSVMFGSSSHTDYDDGQSGESTKPGIYPMGGKYDDDSFESLNGASGTGVAPVRLLTYFNVLFIRAELAQAGVTNEDPAQLLSDAIDESFIELDEVCNVNSGTACFNNQDAVLISSDVRSTYHDDIMALFNDADEDRQLEILMTQKWIANFGFAIESYNDYRRTGYPGMYDPDTDNLDFTVGAKDYPTVLPFSQDEINRNDNDPGQHLPSLVKVFWDID